MAKEMNMDTLVKKLKTVSNTQDSIPMLSLWIIHHKAHHKQIVETWLNMLKKSNHQHRLTLLYLCNDVVQNCSRKNAPIYKESFSDVLAEAVTHLRDSSIKSNVQRVVKIWAKRSVFDSDFTDQLLASLITNTAPEKLRNKLLVEYKTTNLIDEIKKFKVIEDELESDQIRLKAIRMDVSNMEAIRKLKDKIGGEKFSREFEESATQLEFFLKRYESYIEGRKSLLDLLDHGTVYYHAQYHEAKIVVNAYKNFENRVKKMKRGVDKVKERFPADSKDLERSRGEDMEMSDEDQNLDKKSNIISSIEPKHRKTLKINDKPLAVPPLPKEDGNPAANMIKLLATGLQSMKSSNSSAADSLKRAMTGLVKRPGMRGASFNSAPSDSAVSEPAAKESFKIVRSVSDATVTNSTARGVTKEPSPSIGEESPPSPTGSPELNISSPPRMQSLDSRLADLFNEDGTAAELKSQTEASESDSDSDTDLIKRANRLLDLKTTNLLPGLGDLDQVSEPVTNEQKIASETLPQQTENKTEIVKDTIHDTLVATTQDTTSALEKTLTPVVNHAIPVIGGMSRVAAPLNDGSSTPTLDEKPYSPPSAPNPYIPPPLVAGMPSHAPYGGDALSFLSKIMGNPAKADVVSTASAPTPTAPAITQPSPVTANTLYGNWATPPTWAPANSLTPSTIASTSQYSQHNLWSSPPPLPNLPPPPTFSWSGKPDPSLPPPWQNLASAMARPPQLSATEAPTHTANLPTSAVTITNSGTSMPPPWSRLSSSTTVPTAVNNSEVILPKVVSAVNNAGVAQFQPQTPSSTSPIPRPNFPDPFNSTAPPPVKKSKWDVKDQDLRSFDQEAAASTASVGEQPLLERRSSLITVPSVMSTAQAHSTQNSQPALTSSGDESVSPSVPLRVKAFSLPKRIGFGSISVQENLSNDSQSLNSVTMQPISLRPPLKSPTASKEYDALGQISVAKQAIHRPAQSSIGPKHYDVDGNLALPHKISEPRRNSADKLTPITPPPQQFDSLGTPPVHSIARHEYDAQGNEIASHESAIHLRIKEARLKASHPRPELSSEPFKGPHFRPEYNESRGPLPFEEVPRPRHRFEQPREGFNDEIRSRPSLPQPHEAFGEMSRHRPRLERPRESFNEMIDLKRPISRMERPELHHKPRLPHRARSPPPPRSFHSPDPRAPPPVRRRSVNEMADIELALMRDEHMREREKAILRDSAMMDDIDRMATPRPWFSRPRGPPPPSHLRPHGPRGPPFRSMRPRMHF